MITKRIIPCLDVRNGRVVKGTNFEGIRDVADPVEMARMYNAAGADELVFYDITASFEGRALFTDILTRVASEIFIPLTVGGGINTLEVLTGAEMRCRQSKCQLRCHQEPGHYFRRCPALRQSVRGAFGGHQASGWQVQAVHQRQGAKTPALTRWTGWSRRKKRRGRAGCQLD